MSGRSGEIFWYFDGAHRNVTMVDAEAGTKWMVDLDGAPGFDGAEVSHPRWTNHPRFLAITGPYNQGGDNQSRTGGKQTEVYFGRFTEDFSNVEGWLRVTNNGGGDADPDVWIDLDKSKYQTGAGTDWAVRRCGRFDCGQREFGQGRALGGERPAEPARDDPDACVDTPLSTWSRRQRVRGDGRRAGHLCGKRDPDRPVGDP